MENKFLSFLKEKKIIGDKEIEEIKRKVEEKNLSIIDAILETNLIEEKDLANLLSEFTGLVYIEIHSYEVDPNVIKLIDGEFCRENFVFPLFEIENKIFVAIYNPFNLMPIEELKIKLHKPIEIFLTTKKEIENALKFYYKYTDELIKTITKATTYTLPEILPYEVKPEIDIETDAPVIKIVELLFKQAIQDRATDIHIDPESDRVDIKFRIDGFLHTITSIPLRLHESLISRIKIMAGMDIGEKRLPQDGFIKISENGNKEEMNIRVATFPTINGEKCVLRILPKEKILLHLENLGMLEDDIKKVIKLISQPFGFILITGPTGSGKTTTLYALLEKIIKKNKNILTIEEPVEIDLPGIYQSNVNPDKNWTFDVALKAMLRMDPDVIMVGEIRDAETAKLAVQSALTGHLVLSTLHTKDSFSVPVRLIEIGIEPFLITSSLIGVINQRLVRVICPYCKEEYKPEKKIVEKFSIEKDIFFRGKGCKNCIYTGFLGRTGVFEVLIIDDKMRKSIINNPTSDNIKRIAKENGIKELIETGIELVKRDITTIEEIIRVCGSEEYGYISV